MKRIILILALLILVTGCKEKAEAKEWPEIVKGEFRWADDIPKEPKLDYTVEDFDRIYKDEPALGRLAKDLYGLGEGRILWRENLQNLTCPKCGETASIEELLKKVNYKKE